MRKGWEIKILSEACKVFADGDWIESKDQSSEGIRLIQTGNIGFGYYKDKVDKSRFVSEETFKRLRCTEIKAGDLLVSRLPDPVGKSCIIPETNTKMITGVDCTIIRPKDFLLSEFLCYYQMSDKYLKDVQIGVSGATRQRISRKNLGQIKIPLPPLSEQQEIISILDDAFESIELAKLNAEQNLKNAKELFESCLQNMFKNKSEGWSEKTLGDICTTTQCVQIEKSEQLSELLPKYKRYLYISDFKNEKNIKYVKDIYPKKNVTTDDLIVVNTGNSAGDIFKGIDGILSNNLFKVSYNKNIINGQFLYYFVTSKMFRNYQTKIIRGTANPHMGHENFNSTPFSFPLIHDQEIIVKKLDALAFETKKLESIYQQKLNDLEELKKSILQKAFNGELKTSKISA